MASLVTHSPRPCQVRHDTTPNHNPLINANLQNNYEQLQLGHTNLQKTENSMTRNLSIIGLRLRARVVGMRMAREEDRK